MSHLLLMVISLAQSFLSWAKFQQLWVISKIYNFADIGLAVGMPACFAPTKECFNFKHSRWFGKRHKIDAFTKLGEPTIRVACTPQTTWPAFLIILTPFLLLLPVSGHLSHSFTAPPTKCAYSVLHLQALTECSPLDFWRSSITGWTQHISMFTIHSL